MTDTERVLRVAGPVAIVVAFGGILSAVAVAPWFSWSGNALSDLGEAGRASSPFFNGGLVLAGGLGVAYAGYLRTVARNVLHRLAVATHVAAMLGLAGVGIAHVPHRLHLPAAVAAYLGFTATLVLWGAGTVRDGIRIRGAASVFAGVGHLAVWVLWALFLVPWLPGLAVPETVGALLYAGWVFGVTRGTHDAR
ncbi:DUF998 domain-containing protein [Natronomonas sp. EA1]|uniref:DUF998 domain-containing protein n=1 Tax=Natronomonas sp. EA1 TaxID=3421655 RepID=UPI003EB6D832